MEFVAPSSYKELGSTCWTCSQSVLQIGHIATCQKSWAYFNWWGPWLKISSVLPLIGYASFVQHVCSAQAYILCQTCLLCPSIYFMSNMVPLPKHIFYVKHVSSAQAYILCQTCLLCPSIYFMSNMLALPKHICYVRHACSAQAYILCQTCLLCPSIYFMSNMFNEGILEI